MSKNKNKTYRAGTAVPVNIENKCKYYVLNTKQKWQNICIHSYMYINKHILY